MFTFFQHYFYKVYIYLTIYYLQLLKIRNVPKQFYVLKKP